MNDSNKINLLIKEYENIHKSLINNSNMRLGALGASLTLLGLVISFASNVKFPEILGVYIILIVVVFACIRIIAAVNRTIFVFANHIKWVEKELGIMGFSTYWGNYLKKNIKDSGSYAFIVASRVINFSISVYIIFAAINNF